jgi:GTP cyclohydrolase II
MMVHMAECAFEESRLAGSHHGIGYAMARVGMRYVTMERHVTWRCITLHHIASRYLRAARDVEVRIDDNDLTRSLFGTDRKKNRNRFRNAGSAAVASQVVVVCSARRRSLHDDLARSLAKPYQTEVARGILLHAMTLHYVT